MMKTIRKCGKQIALVMVGVLVLVMMLGSKAYAVAPTVVNITSVNASFPDGNYSGKSIQTFASGTYTLTVGPSGTACDVIITTTSSGNYSVIIEAYSGSDPEGNQYIYEATSSTSVTINGVRATFVGSADSGFLTGAHDLTFSVGAGSASSGDTETEAEKQARLEEERKSSHFEVISTSGEKMESEVKGSFYYEQGAAVVKGDDAICRDKDDYAVNTYVASETCQSAAYASLTGYATEGGYTVTAATSFNIIDLENNPYCESVSWFEANENNTITGNTKTFAFSDGRTITTDKYTKAVAGLPEKTEGKVIVVGVTKGGVVFTQEDQDDDPATVTFDALLGNGVYGFLVK